MLLFSKLTAQMKAKIKNIITFFKKQWVIITCLPIVALIIYFVLIPNHSYFSEYFEPDTPYGYGELFRIYLTIGAGIIAIIALVFNHRRVTAMEKNNVDTRFNNAVGHLGNENPTVVLGGIHALHQIAVKHESYTQVVHNLFCSYLRENSAKIYEENGKKTPDKCPVIIQTLIDYLFPPHNKDNAYKNFASNLSFSTLKNCDFNHRTLANCHFNDTILTNCYFSNTTFIDCYFIRATLSNCEFWRTTLTECVFISKYFAPAKLFDCHHLETVTLIGTELPPNKKK